MYSIHNAYRYAELRICNAQQKHGKEIAIRNGIDIRFTLY